MGATTRTDALPALKKFRGRHFLDDMEYTGGELRELLDFSLALKELWKSKPLTPFLPGKHLGVYFESPSTRTRLSFETGMAELGGDAAVMSPADIHIGRKESVADTARTFGCFCGASMLRLNQWSVLGEFAAASPVPVINGMVTDWNHPLQSMSDALTILEREGHFDGVTVALVGPTACVLDSNLPTLSRLGVDLRLAAVDISPRWSQVRELTLANCGASGGSFYETDDPVDAVQGADYVLDSQWTWYGTSEEERERIIRDYWRYQVNGELWKHTKPGAKYMNCLPAARGEHVTAEVIDGPQSIVWQEAENRKHFQKGLLLALIGIDDLPQDPDIQDIGRALLT
jgi:ornithine carbamoyltransferase